MIAGLLLSSLLSVVLGYSWLIHKRVPLVAWGTGGAALLALWLVWVPEHATVAAAFFGIGRGVDLFIYLWIIISLLLFLNLHLKLRTHMEMITDLARRIAVDRYHVDQKSIQWENDLPIDGPNSKSSG